VDLLSHDCRFRDCSHRSEPGCAVRQAVQEGSLALRRFESWQHLQRELRWIAARKDARLRADRVAERKRRSREGW
jgi:ribosome biogenesis GTPase